MPTIAIVDGVIIMIYPNDHIPPHVHATIAEHECRISIVDFEVLSGDLPKSKLRKVKAWLKDHADAVSSAWEAVYDGHGFKGRIE
jgi:hypothetical protein